MVKKKNGKSDLLRFFSNFSLQQKTPLFAYTLTFLFFLSCGIEEYPSVLPVPQSNITQVFNDYAEVRIPGSSSYYSPTTHFLVFYRIYVSDVPVSSTTFSDFASYSAINSALSSDFNSIRPYIDSDTLINVNMDSMFRGRGYRTLCLSDPLEIDNILNSSIQGKTIIFNFPSSRIPFITIDSIEYTLWRSNGNGTYNPVPDRLFLNRPDLYNPDNLIPQTNADVMNKSNMSGTDRYTYAAMYIVAVGIDNATYSNIYSTPALIHVFLLPD